MLVWKKYRMDIPWNRLIQQLGQLRLLPGTTTTPPIITTDSDSHKYNTTGPTSTPTMATSTVPPIITIDSDSDEVDTTGPVSKRSKTDRETA
jgi:hypothetical protein